MKISSSQRRLCYFTRVRLFLFVSLILSLRFGHIFIQKSFTVFVKFQVQNGLLNSFFPPEFTTHSKPLCGRLLWRGFLSFSARVV